jgi:hypothetical protein
MSAGDGYEPPEVVRVRTDTGSHVEPPLDQSWDDLTALRWHAAVTEYDTGVRIRVYDGQCSTKRRGRWVVQHGVYSFTIGGTGCGGYPFGTAWAYLNGVGIGAREAAPLTLRQPPPPAVEGAP